MEFEKIKVELYLSGSWTNITNNVVSSNGIQLTPRIDGTFMVGTFDAWLDTDQIPAYTPMRITYNNENIIYCVVTSTINKYLLEQDKYYHTFDVFEATAILSNFIVGSKAFSVKGTNKSDYDKIVILRTLMKNKYGITINIDDLTSVLFNKEREFTFGAGTTLYNALSAIMEEYNFIPYVTIISSTINFTISYINRDTATPTTITYNPSEATRVVKKQNLDNYCNYLETEAQNVVDRTNTTTWSNLTVRSEETRISEDTEVLLLPNKVEEIKELKILSTSNGFYAYIYGDYSNLMSYTDAIASIGNINQNWYKVFNYLAAVESVETTSTTLYKILHSLFYQLTGISYSYWDLCALLDTMTWEVLYNNDNDPYYRFGSGTIIKESLIDVTDCLKEKSDWDILDVTERPKYMYYESETNVIKNLASEYKNDFWGNITGLHVPSWYADLDLGIEWYCDGNGNEISKSSYYNSNVPRGYVQNGTSGFNPINGLFTVKAVVTADPIIINEKTIPSLNENNWKPYARSYNAKANKIEFDKLEERMQISNNMLGDVELELEVTNPSFIPLISTSSVYTINYDDNDYYVTNYVINVRLDSIVIVYSLSRNQSKKAEIIGVETQFEATPNPLKNIITRPIYIEAITGLNKNLNTFNYLEFTFKDINGNRINYGTSENPKYTTLYKRFSVLQNGNTKMLYCEMIDQYTFDYNSKTYTSGGINYLYRNLVPYVDGYNEIYSVTIRLCNLLNINVNTSKLLPEYNGVIDGDSVTLANNVILYKDAREHLTFTIKLN